MAPRSTKRGGGLGQGPVYLVSDRHPYTSGTVTPVRYLNLTHPLLPSRLPYVLLLAPPPIQTNHNPQLARDAIDLGIVPPR